MDPWTSKLAVIRKNPHKLIEYCDIRRAAQITSVPMERIADAIEAGHAYQDARYEINAVRDFPHTSIR